MAAETTTPDPPIYRHRQYGSLPLALGALAFVALAVVLTSAGAPTIGALVLLLLSIWLSLFWCLTVTVTHEHLRVAFGWGLVHKSFAIDHIAAVRPVRNRWYYGWGIRLYPGGWLYNVAGLDAVEISLPAGRKARIGTDQPQALAQAIAVAAGLPLPAP